MSHFTTMKSKIVHKDQLITALKQMKGVKEVSENATVRGYQGKTSKAEVVATMSGKYDIGLSKGDNETFSLEADWWGVRQGEGTWSSESFTKELTKRYTEQTVLTQLQNSGYSVASSTVDANTGNLVIIANQW